MLLSLVVMIHPSNILRADSVRSNFIAPNQKEFFQNNEADCGLKLLPCLSQRLKLEKYYRITIFVVFVTILGVFHSSSSAYFTGTNKVWRQNFNLSEKSAEWIVNLGAIFGGIFALLLAHWGNVIHRPSYIGGIAMLHAIAGWVLIVPEVYHPRFSNFNSTAAANPLCRPVSSFNDKLEEEYDDGKKNIAICVLIVYQLVHSLAIISLICHGISYIDDGCRKFAATTMVCLVVTGYQLGRFSGLNLTLIPIAFNRHIFFSFAWLINMTLIFIFGFLISLFPKFPKRMMVGFGVDRILNRTRELAVPQVKGFWSSLGTILSSKLLVVNVASAAVMHIAIVNFALLREEFFRSRFINFSDEFDYHFTFFNISQMIFMSLIVVVLGVIIAKKKPSTTFFVIWIAVSYILILVLFVSYAFLKCEDQLTFKYGQINLSCNGPCHCNMEVFAPVCLEQKTYYSACYAGCTHQYGQNFVNCACASSKAFVATEGSCNAAKCNVVSFLAEGNGVITLGLKVSAFIIHVIIALRSVDDQNLKSLALGFLLTGTMLLPYVPFKFCYDIFTQQMCNFNQNGECLLFKSAFPTTLSIVTGVFMLLSVVITLTMLRFSKQVNMYKRSNTQRNSNINGSHHHELEEVRELPEEENSPLASDQYSLSLQHSSPSPRLGETFGSRLESEGYSDGDIDEELARIDKPNKKDGELTETEF